MATTRRSLATVVSRPELGVLGAYATADVSDILVNGHEHIWLNKEGRGLVRVPSCFTTEREVREFASALLRSAGRHIDDVTPFANVHVGRGVRVHAVLPPISQSGTTISIRIAPPHAYSLSELQARGFIDETTASLLAGAVLGRANLLIAGATGSGKTTLLRALLSIVPASQRIVCIEDVTELVIGHPHVVSLQARQRNVETAGEVTLSALVQEALRMRPDRIVVGECRGAEVRELFSALNTGHAGGAGTVHANSLDHVVPRLEAMASLASLTGMQFAHQLTSAIDLVVFVRGEPTRAVESVGRLRRIGDDRVEVVRVAHLDGTRLVRDGYWGGDEDAWVALAGGGAHRDG